MPEPRPDVDPLMFEAYMAALDEVYALRRALAYESQVVAAQTLDVSRLGSGRRTQLTACIGRMAGAARGEVDRIYAGTSRRALETATTEVGGSNVLTRAMWEAQFTDRGDPDA